MTCRTKKELKRETNGAKGGEINCFSAENRYLLSLNLKCYFCTEAQRIEGRQNSTQTGAQKGKRRTKCRLA